MPMHSMTEKLETKHKVQYFGNDVLPFDLSRRMESGLSKAGESFTEAGMDSGAPIDAAKPTELGCK
ncbi:MAG: hypothetical protein R2942_06180 [Ignavibacteria bacterium]